MSLAGKVVVVTGVTGNVGWGVAHAARDAGATLALPVRTRSADLEPDFGGADVVATVDYADPSSVARFRDEVLARRGRIDHVVAPLGAWWQKGASLAQPPSELRGLLGTYVEAQWLLLATMAPALRETKGSYTFVTGAAGESPLIPDAGLLGVAVSAQIALSRTMRLELAREPFRTNEIRIATRIEREARPRVVPARTFGSDILGVLEGAARGALFRYSGAGRLAEERS